MRADGVFDRSVVLLYEESSQHVAGLILNKPTKTKLKKILEVKGFKTVKVQDLIYRWTSQSRKYPVASHR